jgi:hypothetical protein
MIVNFNIELDGTDFVFHTVNRIRLQLYQVYMNYEGKKCRFHMEIGDDGNFHITDKTVCPAVFLPLEATMSDAIKKLGELKTSVLN